MIQDAYGAQNTADEVSLTDSNEAVLWVKAEGGATPLLVNLTNLAVWRADGTIETDDELKREWLGIRDA